MIIRLASASDLAAVTTFYHEVSDAMIGTPYDCCWRRDMHPSDAFIARLVTEGGMMMVEEDEALIGAAGIDHDLGHDYGALPWLVDADESEVAVIHLLAVDTSRRKAGIARRLLRACIDEARTRGLRTVRLDVTDNNEPARALYRSEGFSPIGSGLLEVGPEERPLVRLEVMELPL